MIIDFDSYNDMINFPVTENETIGYIKNTAKIYTYDSIRGKWITSNEDKCLIKEVSVSDSSSVIQKLSANSYSIYSGITSTCTKLGFVLEDLPDTKYLYEYKCKFTTPATLGITVFSIGGPGSSTVIVGDILSSRLIKFTAAQLNYIYATLADQIILTATSSIYYTTSTSTLTVGTDNLVLTGSLADDAYFLLGSDFGTVIALGSFSYDYPALLEDITWLVSEPALLANTIYEIAISNGTAIMVGSV